MQSVTPRQIGLLCVGLVVIAFASGQYTARLFSSGAHISTEEFARALESRDWVERAHVISGYVKKLGPENLPPALAAVEKRRRWLSQDELRLFMGAWARFDPRAAFARSLTWPDHTRNKGAAAVIYGWALEDPEAAHAAAQAVADSNLQALLLDRLVAAWAHGEDREGVTLYIAGLPDTPSRTRLTSILVREILADGHSAVMTWAQGIPEAGKTGFKAIALERAAGILAQDDHAVAVEFVERNRETAEIDGAFAAVTRRWASTDPEAALTWAKSWAPGAGRDRAVQVAFIQWQKKNPAVAEKWLLANEASSEFDPARLSAARQLAVTSPLQALEFAQSVSDPSVRERSLVGVLAQWFQMDDQAASSWLAENPLSESAMTALESQKKNRRRTGPKRKPRQAAPGNSGPGKNP